ncbi:hypothetical protein D3C83_184240 [compost metagenome]
MSSRSAPRTMSSRLTLAANALSFIFLRTDETATLWMLLSGRTRATAIANPLSSSTAQSVFSNADSGATPL